jgi:hypothetical protein
MCRETSEVNSCHGCGHRYYDGGHGLCKWCKEEAKNPNYCVICGNIATCRGNTGYLCGASGCSHEDEDKSWNKYIEENW